MTHHASDTAGQPVEHHRRDREPRVNNSSCASIIHHWAQVVDWAVSSGPLKQPAVRAPASPWKTAAIPQQKGQAAAVHLHQAAHAAWRTTSHQLTGGEQ